MRTKFDSTIAKALASTVLVSSCSPDASFLQPLSEHEDSTSKELNDSKGVSISLNINDKMREDLNNLEPLVNEILNDSTAAKEFAANPNLFCTQHGYAMTLDSNDSIMKVSELQIEMTTPLYQTKKEILLMSVQQICSR